MAVPGRSEELMEDDENDVHDGLLIEEGALVMDADSETPPHLRDLAVAAQSGDLSALSLALENLEGSIDEPVEDGDTALHLTCLYGHLSCVQLLLEKGASIEAKDAEGAIPLHDACAGGYEEIVNLLICGATNQECVKRMLDTADIEGDTPLHHAARGEHADIIRILLAHGASPTKKNSYDKIPAELADPGTEARTILEVA